MLKLVKEYKSSLKKFILITLMGCLYAGFLSGIVGISSSWSVSASEYVVRTYKAPDEIEARFKEEENYITKDFYPMMYMGNDADVYEKNNYLSPILSHVAKRDIVYVIESEDEYNKVITFDGLIGYVHSRFVEDALENIFDETEEIYYAAEDLVLLAAPYENAAEVASLNYNSEIYIVGKNDYQYWKAEYENLAVYVDRDLLMEEKYIPPTPIVVAPVQTTYSKDAYVSAYNGAVLNRYNGTIMGPSGKETYYNLPMGGVIYLMQAAGFYGEYWVRDDGVKMYGDYVMAACGFMVRPRGTIVETSLGTAICADTGTFSYANPYQIDIAVDW